MTCCGNIIDITTGSDVVPVFLCQHCGKQGPEYTFPDPPEPLAPAYTRSERFRLRIAEALDRIAAFVAPH